MRAFGITVAFWMAFIAAGNALECLQCVNRNSSTCTEVLQTCPADVTTCEHSIAEFDMGAQGTINQIFKGCSETLCNPLAYGVTVTGVKNRIKRICCEGDSCNNGTISFPPTDNTPNGRKCPACFEANTFTCSQTEMINCTGDEIGCFTFKGYFDISGGSPVQTAGRGCINRECCHPLHEYPGHMVPGKYSMICGRKPQS